MLPSPVERLSTRPSGRREARRSTATSAEPPALPRGSPGGSAGGLGPARRGRLGSQNTKTRLPPAVTLRLVGVPERLSRRDRIPRGPGPFALHAEFGFLEPQN